MTTATQSAPAWVSAAGVVLADLVPAELRRTWVRLGHCPDRDLYSLFSEHVRTCPQRDAVVDDDAVISYVTLDLRVRAVAAELAGAGLGPGDIIAIQLPSDWRAVTAELAVAAVGGVALPYPAARGRRDCLSLLGRARARAVITADACAAQTVSLRPALPALRTVFTFGAALPGCRSLDSWQAGSRPADSWRAAPVDPEAPARILVSSGSETEPKMVAYSHNAMAGGRGNYIAALHGGLPGGFPGGLHGGLPGGDEPMRSLILVPLASSYGSCGTSVIIARHGGTVLLLNPFDPAEAVRLMIKHRPSLVFGVPTMFGRMAGSRVEGADFSALRALVSSGAPLPATTAEACQARFGVPVINVYGSADGVNCHTVATPGIRPAPRAMAAGPGADVADVADGRVGRPDPAVAEIRIADSAGAALPSGQEGEIWARGPMTPLCYVNAPELDARYRAPGGWVRTGDKGVLEPDGSLRVTGRLRQVVIRGGYNISPAEVEREIGAHPAVAEGGCVGVPHPDLGERLCACLAQHPGTSPLSVRGLGTFLEAERGLERKKLPELLLLLPELPLGPTGKVCRQTLARLAAERHASLKGDHHVFGPDQPATLPFRPRQRARGRASSLPGRVPGPDDHRRAGPDWRDQRLALP
jgi:acyl-CoA synthetase (AMP-forming)/AMP-acid ligase II